MIAILAWLVAIQTNKKINRDCLWWVGLLIAALILYGYNSGSLPLRDWDEGTVAMVAREIWRSPLGSNIWLYPMLQEQPYWNKPPLIHWLIAVSYSWFGVNEWSTRLAPSVISAFSVPLLYGIAREVFKFRLEAICSALVYLTLLPMVRHGRLAMLDGAIACWFCLTIWSLLRGRRQPPFYLGVGIGLCLICLTKGAILGILLGVIAVLFVVWEQRSLLKSSYFWLAICLGLLPAIVWYCLQYWHYGAAFINNNLGNQSLNRIWSDVENNGQAPWYYLLEISKYTLPWLLFLPGGIKLAIKNHRTTWARLALVWGGVYLLAVSFMSTKLPWYVIPIYPAFSLLVGANLAKIRRSIGKNLVYWQIIAFGILALLNFIASIFYFRSDSGDRLLGVIFIELTIAFLTVAMLLSLKSRYFFVVLVGSWYFALLLFFHSSHWIWELAEDYPVKPVAAMVARHTLPEQVIYVRSEIYRPSLAFYSDRHLVTVSEEEMRQLWLNEPTIYALVPQNSDRQLLLDLNKVEVLNTALKWQLITKNKDFRQINSQ